MGKSAESSTTLAPIVEAVEAALDYAYHLSRDPQRHRNNNNNNNLGGRMGREIDQVKQLLLGHHPADRLAAQPISIVHRIWLVSLILTTRLLLLEDHHSSVLMLCNNVVGFRMGSARMGSIVCLIRGYSGELFSVPGLSAMLTC